MADSKRIADTRISRTPIYQTTGDGWPEGKAAEYDPATKRISVLGLDNGRARRDIPHESAHAIFDKAGLAPASGKLVSGVPPEVNALISYFPQLYRPLSGTDPSELKRHREMIADEGLAYSVGRDEGTPYVEHVASQIKDSAIAAQLLRLHRNALANNSTGNLLRSPIDEATDQLSAMQRTPSK
jgi:hypothetical protein